MNRIFAVLAVSGGMLLTAVPITAHHSFEAEYDRTQKVTLKGKVTKVEWQNPHVYYYVDVADPAGAVVNWAIEVGAPNGLYRAGWRKDSLKIGDQVTVEGFRAKAGGPHINGSSVVLPDGKKVFSGQNDGGPGRN
ncbi:MAG TPA: DUF6152 family protein [Vicinamibacterales bacterium]|jgi:hypothetical protein